MEEESRGSNRLFVILAISLIGLLVLGLLGVGGVFVIRQNMQEQADASRPTPTLIIRLPNPTASPTRVLISPTNTPAPTPVNTPVINPDSNGPTGGQEAAVGSGEQAQKNGGPKFPAHTPAAPKANPASATTVPATGVGGLEIGLIAVGLIALFFVARRLRMAS
jgi:hypothetical protein